MEIRNSEKTIAVITAIFGEYDAVPPVPVGFDDAVLVSDREIESEWRNVVIKRNESPRLASKFAKFRPDLFTTCNSSVWVDASMRDEQNWLRSAVEPKLAEHDLVFFKHPQRNNVLAELLASLELDKYLDQPLSEQVHSYQVQGFRDDIGLWAGGVIARNHTFKNIQFGDAWLEENQKWSIQDQLSLPYIAWKLQIIPGHFDEDQYTGPLKWIQHKGELQESLEQQRKWRKNRNKFRTLCRLIKKKQFLSIWYLIKREIRAKTNL